MHLRSDVPIGTCLSGGLDSSSIVCMVRSELQKRGVWRDGWQHTFSACFEDPRLDERRYIQAVATETGCRTHFIFPLAGSDWQKKSTSGFGIRKNRSGDSVCMRTIVLLGWRGNMESRCFWTGRELTNNSQGTANLSWFTSNNSSRPGTTGERRRKPWHFSLVPEILRTCRFVDGRRYLLSSFTELAQLWPNKSGPSRPASLALGNSLAQRLKADLIQFSLPVLLRYDDRNTMAFGVESRVPFVDHVFVEWLASILSADMRLSRGWTKHIRGMVSPIFSLNPYVHVRANWVS